MPSHMAKSGMVAAAHPLAVVYGLEALREGGNAMDACLVMAGVTAVTMPHMCGLGGDAFFIYYDASTGTIAALNGSGAGGDASTPDFFAGRTILPQDGILSVGVPGAPLVYELAQRRFGTFGLEKCFEPAVKVAREGFPVSAGFSKAIASDREKLLKYEGTRDVFLPGGNPPKAGTIMRRPDMADTLRSFGEGGAEYFYKGAFAQNFYRMNNAMGGTFTGREFSRHMDQPSTYYDPIRTDYRGYTILQTAPVSQGFIVLEEMNLLEGFDVPSMDPYSGEVVHLMVETKKVAFADRNRLAGDDPSFDVGRLISKDYAAGARRQISLDQASGEAAGPEDHGETTSFVAWDKYGNCCSFIHSNAFTFGSAVMVPGTGVLLNNRVGRSFVLEPGHPNCLAPNKLPMHTLNCYMVLKDGVPFIVGGTPGGDGQPQWNMQMLSLMLDHNMEPQETADFPRWISSPGTDVVGLGKPFEVRIESEFPALTANHLASLGHAVRIGAAGGNAQIIMKKDVLLGGSDKRGAGLALGY